MLLGIKIRFLSWILQLTVFKGKNCITQEIAHYLKMKCNSQSVKLRQKSKIPGKLYFTTVYFIVVFFDNKSEVISEMSYINTICSL